MRAVFRNEHDRYPRHELHAGQLLDDLRTIFSRHSDTSFAGGIPAECVEVLRIPYPSGKAGIKDCGSGFEAEEEGHGSDWNSRKE